MDSSDFSTVSYTTTPLKSNGSVGSSPRRQICDQSSSNHYKTPVRCNESVIKRGKGSKQSSVKGNYFKTMPIYSPPTDVIGHVKNPFEHARYLKERLSQPICSPSLFEKKTSPVKDDQFTWSIEDISVLRPAPISENPMQEFDSWFSPGTENEAQKAINKFFSSQIVNMESPVDVRSSRIQIDSPVKKETTESWSQTLMTFPPNLPPEIEKLLSNFCTFNDDEFSQDYEDYEDLDSSNCSNSRKKLSFDSIEDEAESLCNTPLQEKCIKQTVASTPITTILSSPELSPILISKVPDSPMDVSMSLRSTPRLSLAKDINVMDKENVQLMSWNYNISNMESTDSAFSSV